MSMCEWPFSQSRGHFFDCDIMENETVLHSQPRIEAQERLEKKHKGAYVVKINTDGEFVSLREVRVVYFLVT